MSNTGSDRLANASTDANGDSHVCAECDRSFRTNRGLNQHLKHLRSCYLKNKITDVQTPYERKEDEANDQTSDDSNIEIQDISTPSLQYKWGNYQDYLFERNLSLAYEKIVYWKKNLFLLPSGQAGKSFIDEMSRLMNEWIRESPLKDIAFKAIMVMPGLLLQKPSRKSKSKDHLTSLENRMKLWHAGEIMELLKEAETIQKDLRVSNTPSTIAEISKKFTREMRKGNINSAMKLLADNMQNGILPLNDQTLHQIKQKHPHGKDAHPEVLLPDIPEEIHPIKFHSIDAESVKKAILKTKGAAGPSGLDADGWKRILTSNQFGNSSNDLCKTFAEVIKKLCTTEDLSSSLEALLACRLIPLDKNPGLRPIGIGEVLRRIASKVVVSHIREDIISAVGSLQVCAGQEAGYESFVHAMREIHEDQSSEAVLLVDALNAFNKLIGMHFYIILQS